MNILAMVFKGFMILILIIALVLCIAFTLEFAVEQHKKQKQYKEITVDQYEEIIKWLQDYKHLNEDTIRFMSDNKIDGYEYVYLKEHVKELKLIRYKAQLPYLNKVWKYNDWDGRNKIQFHDNRIDLSKAERATTDKVKD